MLPIIAIVGRPNVGKSTLFNRLIRKRQALISSFPGTTRDRQYGKVSDGKHAAIFIDTGGIMDTPNRINQAITEQAKQAMLEADKILFLVDCQEGVTADDHAIADELRKTCNKPIYLVVNKCEGKDPDLALADFYALGLNQPLAISAAHNAGMNTLLAALLSDTDESPTPITEKSKAIKFAIIGKPNVGKSTLTNRILGEQRVIVDDSPGTTRDSIAMPFERFGKEYIVVDTAGVRRRKNIHELPEKFSIVKTLQAIEEANIIVYLIDGSIGMTEQDLKLLSFVLENGKGLCIAVNKWDNLSSEIKDATKASIDRHLNFISFARIHFISALHGTGVGHLFDSIDEAYESATRALATPLLTKLLKRATDTHTPPLVQGRRIKMRYAHPGGHNPPRIIIHGNQLESLPDSYKRYLAHYFQTHLKLFGTPVEIEFKINPNPYAK
jgi:GTPase